MANKEIRYFVVGVEDEDIGPGFVGEALFKSGIKPVSINEVDPEKLPPQAFETPTDEDLFRRVVFRHLGNLRSPHNRIIDALQRGKGEVSIDELRNSGIPDEDTERTLKTFAGTIDIDPRDPRVITCRFFFPKEEISEAVQNP